MRFFTPYSFLFLLIPLLGIGTVLARLAVFPVIVKGQREAAKLNNVLPEITKLTNKMNEAKQSGNKFECKCSLLFLRFICIISHTSAQLILSCRFPRCSCQSLLWTEPVPEEERRESSAWLPGSCGAGQFISLHGSGLIKTFMDISRSSVFQFSNKNVALFFFFLHFLSVLCTWWEQLTPLSLSLRPQSSFLSSSHWERWPISRYPVCRQEVSSGLPIWRQQILSTFYPCLWLEPCSLSWR